MWFALGDQITFELRPCATERFQSGFQSICIAVVADEVGTAAFALDDDRPGSAGAFRSGASTTVGEEGRCDAGAFRLEPAGVEKLAVGMIQPAGDVDAVLGDGAADLGGDGLAAQPRQPGDRESLEFEMGEAFHASFPRGRPWPRFDSVERLYLRLEPDSASSELLHEEIDDSFALHNVLRWDHAASLEGAVGDHASHRRRGEAGGA